MNPDHTTLQLALERQAASLTPIAAHLNVAGAYSPMPPAEWLGPASREYGLLEAQLRVRLAAAERLVAGALADTRRALAELGA